MTNFDLLELIGQADDQYVMDSRKRPKKRRRKQYLPYALAAVLLLAVLGTGTGVYLNREKNEAQAPAAAAEMETAAAQTADTAETADAAVQETAGAGNALGGAVLLASAQYPEPIGWEDYEKRSQNWTENQTDDNTKTALNSFAYALSARVLGGKTDSGCFSPLSLYQTLSVVASGAKGPTQSQLLSLLGQKDLATLGEQTGKLYRVNYKDNEINKLKIANSLWLDETDGDGNPVGYHQDWVLSAAADYYADVYQAEFSDPTTAERLGSWIAEQTGGLLHPDAQELGFDPDTVMAIVNTLWYKTQWAEPFDTENTSEDTFTTEDGTAVTCDLMHQTDMEGSVVETTEYTKSSLALETGGMVFVLPREGVQLDDLLTEEKLWEIFENSDYTDAEVEWSVPKFQTEITYDLGDVLQATGVTDAFDRGAADFSAMSDTPLYLGKVQQGTHIAVNEDGVEAASYSMAGMLAGDAMPEEKPTVEMKLNRPFLYLITADDGSVLFVGAVRNPEH